jgi:hypothetical protein
MPAEVIGARQSGLKDGVAQSSVESQMDLRKRFLKWGGGVLSGMA